MTRRSLQRCRPRDELATREESDRALKLNLKDSKRASIACIVAAVIALAVFRIGYVGAAICTFSEAVTLTCYAFGLVLMMAAITLFIAYARSKLIIGAGIIILVALDALLGNIDPPYVAYFVRKETCAVKIAKTGGSVIAGSSPSVRSAKSRSVVWKDIFSIRSTAVRERAARAARAYSDFFSPADAGTGMRSSRTFT